MTVTPIRALWASHCRVPIMLLCYEDTQILLH